MWLLDRCHPMHSCVFDAKCKYVPFVCVDLQSLLPLYDMYRSTYLRTLLSIYLSIHPSIHPSIHLSIYLSVRPFIYRSTTFLPPYLPNYLAGLIHIYIYVYIYTVYNANSVSSYLYSARAKLRLLGKLALGLCVLL